ncbi:hypothetical protein Droror1_Dr00009615 [Drosera rotundifolia]
MTGSPPPSSSSSAAADPFPPTPPPRIKLKKIPQISSRRSCDEGDDEGDDDGNGSVNQDSALLAASALGLNTIRTRSAPLAQLIGGEGTEEGVDYEADQRKVKEAAGNVRRKFIVVDHASTAIEQGRVCLRLVKYDRWRFWIWILKCEF